jgi:4'-phosphopantetheinyl transferase
LNHLSTSDLVKRDNIDVWRLNLNFTEERVEEFAKVLTEQEYQRASRCSNSILRNRYIATHWALRQLLAYYLETSPSSVQLIRNEHGKPRLAGTQPNQGLVFNLSHSGEWALFALGWDMALGIDLELKRKLTNMEGMVKRCFASTEQNYWHSLPEDRQLSAFFDLWTAKEAFVKAVGRGIGFGLNRCVVRLDNSYRYCSVPESCGKPEQWSLWKVDVGESFSAALCADTCKVIFSGVRSLRE